MDEEDRQPKTFKVQAKVDMLCYNGSIDTEKLDSWINQLNSYFTVYGYGSEGRVSFARLKMISHALAPI